MNPDIYFASRLPWNAGNPSAPHRDPEPWSTGDTGQEPSGVVPGGGLDAHSAQTARDVGHRGEPFSLRPYATCRKCVGSKLEGLPAATRRRTPGDRGEKVHFALFASMCAIGAVAIANTGPLPLNYALGAAVALLPPALVIKRRVFGRASKKP